ncbi:MAG: hypothetical protein HRF43_08605, partial [Phycisphaerae bacterium]
MHRALTHLQLNAAGFQTDSRSMDARRQSPGPVPACPSAQMPRRGWYVCGPRLRARSRRLFYLLLGAWIINLFDLCLTLLAEQQNMLVEMNPLAARVIPHGPLAVVVYKFAMLSIGTGVLWYCRRHWVTEPAVWMYVFLCIGLSFWWRRVLAEAEPVWMLANTAEKVLPEGTSYSPA